MSARPIRRFTEMLGLLGRMRFEEKLDEHLTNAIETLENAPGDKASATITVTVVLNYEGGRLDVKPAVKSKLPEDKGFAATPFWTFEGGLSVQHPSQMDMFPRDAKDAARDAS